MEIVVVQEAVRPQASVATKVTTVEELQVIKLKFDGTSGGNTWRYNFMCRKIRVIKDPYPPPP